MQRQIHSFVHKVRKSQCKMEGLRDRVNDQLKTIKVADAPSLVNSTVLLLTEIERDNSKI